MMNSELVDDEVGTDDDGMKEVKREKRRREEGNHAVRPRGIYTRAHHERLSLGGTSGGCRRLLAVCLLLLLLCEKGPATPACATGTARFDSAQPEP